MAKKTFQGMEYAEREALKEAAYKEYHQAQTVQGKADAIEKLILAHYERSREAYGNQHPSLEVYAAHWLHASGDQDDICSPDVIAVLVAKYGKVATPRISKGKSYWGK